jgi:hypothetical protein
MRFIKVFGLAAFAAMVAMAFIGANAASAEPDEITLCLKLVKDKELCQKGQLLPLGTTILGLAEDGKFDTTIGTELCEDSYLTAKTAAEIGSPLAVEIAAPSFGKLPTPTLGEGCVGPCTGGIHAFPLEGSQFEVTGVDEFWLKASGLIVLLKCNAIFVTVTCTYRFENVKMKIGRDNATHRMMEGTFDSIAVNTTMARVLTHGGSELCPVSMVWSAGYSIYECHTPSGEHKLCWIALDIKA